MPDPGPITLRFTEGSRAGSFVTLKRRVVTLGRRDDVDVVFDDAIDLRVSGRHARLFVRGGAWWIEDLMSSNGTLVNEAVARGPTRLKTRDIIDLGRHPHQYADGFVQFTVEITSGPADERQRLARLLQSAEARLMDLREETRKIEERIADLQTRLARLDDPEP